MTSPYRSRAGHRVGELAAQTGLTVRALHYYDEIGLVTASGRTDAGHRVYTDDDVQRLYRVCLLRRLGLTLGQISRMLDDPSWSVHHAMAAHLREVERRLEVEGRLRARLAHLLRSVGPSDGPLTDDLLALVEDMVTMEDSVRRRIALLVYLDVEGAYGYLVRTFGLGPGHLARDDKGTVVHGELQAGDGVVWLHPESPHFHLASPSSLGAATACMAVMVDDVDIHFRQTLERGGTIVYEPVDQPYGYREYSARDLEGHLWSFMKPLDGDQR